MRDPFSPLPLNDQRELGAAVAARNELGPVGFEPTTKGFTSPRRFRREWTISSPAHAQFQSVREGAGCSKPVMKGVSVCRQAVGLRAPR